MGIVQQTGRAFGLLSVRLESKDRSILIMTLNNRVVVGIVGLACPYDFALAAQ